MPKTWFGSMPNVFVIFFFNRLFAKMVLIRKLLCQLYFFFYNLEVQSFPKTCSFLVLSELCALYKMFCLDGRIEHFNLTFDYEFG